MLRAGLGNPDTLFRVAMGEALERRTGRERNCDINRREIAESSLVVSSKSMLTLRVHDHNVTLSPQLPPALKAKPLGFDSFDGGSECSWWHASTVATGHGRVTCPAKLTLGKSRRECLLVPERSRYPPTWNLSLIQYL